jgi:hypothetical protein
VEQYDVTSALRIHFVHLLQARHVPVLMTLKDPKCCVCLFTLKGSDQVAQTLNPGDKSTRSSTQGLEIGSSRHKILQFPYHLNFNWFGLAQGTLADLSRHALFGYGATYKELLVRSNCVITLACARGEDGDPVRSEAKLVWNCRCVWGLTLKFRQ